MLNYTLDQAPIHRGSCTPDSDVGAIMNDNRPGILLVVSGPSGVGKGTIIRALLESHPDIELSASCTTRAPRSGEQDGVDYRFVTEAQFEKLRATGQLLEWARVHDHHSYGTPRAPVEAALAQGRSVVLEIDYQGAKSVHEQLGDEAVLIFVAPPSWPALLERLEKRHTESPEAIAERLVSARQEINNMNMYKYVIINDTVGQATAELRAILVAEQQSTTRFDWRKLRNRLLEQAGDTGLI